MKWLVFCLWMVIHISNCALAQNLIYNGSFEQGTAGWTYVCIGSGAYGEVTPDYFGPPDTASGTEGYWNPGSNPDGQNVLSISRNAFWRNDYWVYQEVPTQQGMTFAFRAQFAGGAGPVTLGYNQEEWLTAEWDMGIYNGFYDAGHMTGGGRSSSQIDHRIVGATNPGSINYSFEWTTVSTTFTAAGENATIYLGWSAGSHTSPTKLRNIPFGAYFDVVELTPIPEPSSFLGLVAGLGILGRLRRRS